jgi:drug/metabolite transporter (DMT)-like permease
MSSDLSLKNNNLSLEARGNLSGFLTIVMWSASGLLLAMTGSLPAFELALFTLPFPFIVTAIGWIITGQDWKLKFRYSPSEYAIGTIGIGGYTVFWYLGFKFAPPFQANLINYSWPFFILVFNALIFKQKITLPQILGILLTFLGIFLLFTEGQDQTLSSDYIYGYICALIGALIWSLYSVVVKSMKAFDSDLIAISCLISGIPIFFLHITFEEFVFPQGWGWIGLIGLLLTRTSYLFWNFAMKNGRIEAIVGISYFTPIFSSILLIVFQYASHVGLSALLVLTGALTISWAYITDLIKPSFEK